MINARNYYGCFFNEEILKRINPYSKSDTVNKPKLYSRLDDERCLTIYSGHSRKTLQNCNFLTLCKEDAIKIGRIDASLQNNDNFFCVKGTAKLENAITFINVFGRDEVIILNKNVKKEAKEIFSVENIPFEMF